MRNLIKKSLACLLVAALALTCFVGTLTVSAEDIPTATIVIKADDVEAGAKEIPVTFTVTSTLGINEALIKVSSNLGDIIAQPTVVVDEGVGTAIADPAVENPTDYNSFFLSAVSPDGQAETVMGEVKKATISAVFVNEAGLVAGDYFVDVEIPEGKVIAASAGEVAIKLECTKYEFTVAAAPVEPDCEHVWEYVTATPAEGKTTAAGLANTTTTKVGSITLKCATCNEEITKEVQYYGRTKCFTANAVYESAIQLEFSARKDRLIEAGQYGDAFVRFEHVLPSGTLLESSQKVADGADTVKNTRDSKTWAYSVKAMQLTEKIDTNVFVEIDGVWYSGETYGYSVRSYADTILTYDNVDLTEKTLVVNMLRYGSRMQTYKGYNTENLADADLPAEYAALIVETDPTIDGTYSRNEEIGNDCLQIITSYTLFMDSRTEVRLRVRSDRYTAEPAKDDFVIEAVWDSAKGTERNAKYYNVAYATEDDLTYTQDTQSANAGRWEFYFGECPAYDFRQVVTFKLYDLEAPDTDLGNSFSASFEQLISNGITAGTYKGDELAMYKAMMNYSDAARAHFCK